ncbi:hypothetical protein FA95DRAFT_1553138 [Auriscalpium vulgare]|uniref:Uncharacterized protein n=1 Tax=Auriscalpium vulgare TaxID=40419 RepID=A0ACB8S8X9_9AGAM|nr:hypothetical protein FA95DRAFT_1553138 [Auriscalpium vulgare]
MIGTAAKTVIVALAIVAQVSSAPVPDAIPVPEAGDVKYALVRSSECAQADFAISLTLVLQFATVTEIKMK